MRKCLMKKVFYLSLVLSIFVFISCQEEKQGTLYLLNTSSSDPIELISTTEDTLIVPHGGRYNGLVYFANVYGIWSSKSHYSYALTYCAVNSPYIKSILADSVEYILNDSLSRSFGDIFSYEKIDNEREEYFYEIDDEFLEKIKTSQKQERL